MGDKLGEAPGPRREKLPSDPQRNHGPQGGPERLIEGLGRRRKNRNAAVRRELSVRTGKKIARLRAVYPPKKKW